MQTKQRRIRRFTWCAALTLTALLASACADVVETSGDAGPGAAPVRVAVKTLGIITPASVSPTADTNISSDNPTFNAGGGTRIAVGSVGRRRGLVRFGMLPSRPANSSVSAVSVTMTLSAAGIAVDVPTLALHRLTESFNEGNNAVPYGTTTADGTVCVGTGTTWLNRSCTTDAWGTAGGSYAGASASASLTGITAGSTITWNGAGLVADLTAWYANSGDNHGWAIINSLEGTANTGRALDSRTGATPPTLSVTFTCDSGFVQSGNSCVAYNDCSAGSGNTQCQVGVSTNVCIDDAPPSSSHTCDCAPGFSGDGTTSCADINECNVNNGGCDALTTCTNTPGSRTCGACPSGYTGNGTVGCTDIDECSANSDGCDTSPEACVNSAGSFGCVCPAGYSGSGVGASGCGDVDECFLNTDNCNTNATCTNNTGSFSCACNAGYAGDGVLCVDIDECLGNPCGANGTCSQLLPPLYTCDCVAGYAFNGTTCVVDNECTLNLDNCDPNATCADPSAALGNFTCTCNTGYSGNGTTCTDVNECVANTDNCDASAACANTVGSFTCTCNNGYSGNGVTCTDLNECVLNTDNCNANATCTNNTGSFSCACNAGYSGNGVTCADVDECVANTDNCNANAACSNTIGSFTCTCNTGYDGNGVTCTDLNECVLNTDNCDANAACTNSIGSFSCACNAGYTDNGNGTVCTDINECTANPNICGAGLGSCTNNSGSYACACNPGYVNTGGVPSGVCTDLNECLDDNDNNCNVNATCTNTTGSFTCACNPGYLGTGVACSDADECATGTDLCDDNAVCANTTGAYTCACKAGFTDSGSGRQGECLDNDECASDATNDCNANATCGNTVGSFTCACNTGYAGDGRLTCNDVDECVLGTDTCSDNATCANTTGSFTCTCNAGYFGDGVTCADINECDPTNAQNATNECDEHATCVNDVAGSYRCECWPSYSGSGITCIDVNECQAATDTCRDDQVCTNTVAVASTEPGFTCSCPSNQSEDPAATPLCAVRCGDSLKHNTEGCDDANTAPGDGCDTSCAVEPGYTCAGTPSTCINTCGDGFIDMFEECDEGASNSDSLPDACRTNCQRAECGDGIIDTSETCDDGAENVNLPDRCRFDCQLPTCGDGLKDADEECDDRAASEGIACTACVIEPGAVCHDLGADKPNHCLVEPDAGVPDAGAPEDAGNSSLDAGNGPVPRNDGGIAPDLPVPTGTSATGCSVSNTQGSAALPAWLALSLALGLTVRTRRRSRIG